MVRRRRGTGFSLEEAVESFNDLLKERPYLPFLLPLILIFWGIERWVFSFSSWVPLYCNHQNQILVDDINRKWKRAILSNSPTTPLEQCEWLNKLLTEIWPNYMNPRISSRFSSMVERIMHLGFDWDTSDMSILLLAKLAKPLMGTARIVINSLHVKGEVKVFTDTLVKTMVEPRRRCYSLPAVDLRKKAIGGIIYVTVISASKLSRSSKKGSPPRRQQTYTENGSSEEDFDDKDLRTFVEVELGQLTRRTVERPGSSPQWDSTFNMILHEETGILRFNLYNRIPGNVKYDYLSSCEIKTKYVADDSTTFWAIGPDSSAIAKHAEFCGKEVEMTVPFEGIDSGELKVKLVLKEWHFSDGSHSWNQSRLGSQQSLYGSSNLLPKTGRKINVTVVEAKDLNSRERSGKLDPYAKLQYGKIIRKTWTAHASNPVWNQKFEFDEIESDEYLQIKCYNEEKFGDESIGSARVNLEGLVDGSVRDMWVPLEKVNSGELRLQLEVVGVDDCEGSRGSTGGASNGWIELVLIEAKDLIAADLRGTSDPYVRVQYGNLKKRTKVMYKTLHPQWNQTLEFPDDGSPLELHVKDHNALLPTSSIGNCVVEYQRLPPNQMSDKWIPLQGVKRGEIHIQITRKIPEPQRAPSLDSEASLSKSRQISTQMKMLMIKFQSLIEEGNLEALSTALSEMESLEDMQEEYMMSFAAAKFTELPLRTSYHSLFSSSTPKKPTLHSLKKPFTASSSSSINTNTRRNPNPTAPWIAKWPRDTPPAESQPNGRPKPTSPPPPPDKPARPRNAIDRIVLRLRNIGVGSDDEADGEGTETEAKGGDFAPLSGEERLGDLLKRDWVRPDKILSDDEESDDDVALPWEREDVGTEGEVWDAAMMRKRRVKAPTLAELTLEDVELRRLRRLGMLVRERITIPKAGLTKEVMEKIHKKWRKEELVRLKFHEVLAHDMKTAQELVERRTGGLVIWKAGSVMMVYRGADYQGPQAKPETLESENGAHFVPDVSSAARELKGSGEDVGGGLSLEKSEVELRKIERSEKVMTEEEIEYNSLLDGLGPRFEEWWGTGVLPVDADLLPQKVPGYKPPVRLLPTGMRAGLTNAEMTSFRKLAKSLPCHFALGRNRNHQGLAVAIVKLWEKSLIVKIAVKRGIQNTNNKIMADEIKLLTGGVLLLRNKYYIVIYRGKDFLPTSVATAVAERQEMTKQIQDVEEKVRNKELDAEPAEDYKGKVLAGTLAEFYEAQARWGREVSAEEREKMIEEDSKAKQAKLVKKIEHKLALAQAKRLRAARLLAKIETSMIPSGPDFDQETITEEERIMFRKAQAKRLRAARLLAKIETSMIPSGPDFDQETITEEERIMFRKVGLRMKAYLPIGVRGVFDGVIENMHLHWKYRELVKLISKQKTLAFVEDTAKLLEYESGGILVAIERVPKGFALIYYRGKNYKRPVSIRPRNLLNKAKALKRSVALQRHEGLSQHIAELEENIKKMKSELGLSLEEDDENNWNSEEDGQKKHVSEITPSEDEASLSGSEWEDEDDDEFDIDSEAEEDFEFSSFESKNELYIGLCNPILCIGIEWLTEMSMILSP
ncbi:hypothetical protein Tsubulata_040205, partial [Turnera subulata]